MELPFHLFYLMLLQEIFSLYGEVTNAKTLARTIVGLRNKTPFRNIIGFKQAISDLVKGNPNRYFAQVFQALRLEVNDEAGALREMLALIGRRAERRGLRSSAPAAR